MRGFLVLVQTVAFVALGVWFLTSGSWRMGVAQIFLACVNLAIYW